jgi:DNA-binding NtrC family response regulator
MTPQVLVLSSERSKGETWVAALKPNGLRSKVVQSWPEARLFLTPGASRVIVYDSDFSIAPAPEVFAMASSAKLPVIVMARNFDTSEWLALFKDGAFDVLRIPAAPRQLLESVDSALKTCGPGAFKETLSWPQAAVKWARSWISHLGDT